MDQVRQRKVDPSRSKRSDPCRDKTQEPRAFRHGSKKIERPIAVNEIPKDKVWRHLNFETLTANRILKDEVMLKYIFLDISGT